MEAIAKIIDRLPNRISISGHTEAAAFTGPNGMTNWELSADRANAGRSILTAAGLDSDRIYEVAGKAGSEPLLPEDPNASANRRLSIVLLREAPPAPSAINSNNGFSSPEYWRHGPLPCHNSHRGKASRVEQ